MQQTGIPCEYHEVVENFMYILDKSEYCYHYPEGELLLIWNGSLTINVFTYNLIEVNIHMFGSDIKDKRDLINRIEDLIKEYYNEY